METIKDLWYCTGCRVLKFFPGLNNEYGVKITQVERVCMICNRETVHCLIR